MSNGTKTTFGLVDIKRYFVWSRCPELGPLMKVDKRFALDLDSREHYLRSDEEVLAT